MMRFFRWMLHPVTMIVEVNIAWTVALVFWILFFIRRYRQVEDLALETGLRPQEVVSWAPLVIGILILVFIFAGTIALILSLARQAIVNKQMRNFLSFVSHELRTPLTSISLFLETMRDQEVDPVKQKEPHALLNPYPTVLNAAISQDLRDKLVGTFIFFLCPNVLAKQKLFTKPLLLIRRTDIRDLTLGRDHRGQHSLARPPPDTGIVEHAGTGLEIYGIYLVFQHVPTRLFNATLAFFQRDRRDPLDHWLQ